MLDKLESLENKYEELSELIADPKVMDDQSRWQQYVKSHSELSEVVTVYREYKKVLSELEDVRQMLKDKLDNEMREMAELEEEELENKKKNWKIILRYFCCPKTPMMIRTLSWKSELAPVGRKQPCLAPICSACTRDLPS